ncbi:MAG: hypothetical protein ACRENS_05780 [Candidatus Eiseniibacteriota bacterium]
MSIRAARLFCLFFLVLGAGCRNPIPPADNNQAPETWITSAPQDTITARGGGGRPIQSPPGTIPVQYHIFWAGSDVDGTVAGYYYAVTETTTVAPPGIPLPDLPGPKPRDYHFTTRTDTTFIFNVTENSPDRQHAFFVYSVDNKGRADATPARFIFNAQDRYPPAVIIDDARSTADMFSQNIPGSTPVPFHFVKVITDTFNFNQVVYKDTVPSNGVLAFRWHGEPSLPGTYVTGYRYKLDEPQFVVVDSSVHVVNYNTGPGNVSSAGNKQFTLRGVDVAGGARQVNRRFQLNISPRTWYSGPDPNAYPYTHANGETYVDVPVVTKWQVPALTGSLINDDSVRVLPALRPERKTFFELYKNRIYVRAENDTVHMNSWVVLTSGGFDPDSPYSVKFSPYWPTGAPGSDSRPDTTQIAPGSAVVLHPGPANGSPIGFKGTISNFLTPLGPEVVPSLSPVYPNFDPTSVLTSQIINGYYGASDAGKAYALVKAVDAFESTLLGGQDEAIPIALNETARQIADKVDAGGGTPYEHELRKRVLTFYVDKVPYLVPSDPQFSPAVDGSTNYNTRNISIFLHGNDDDPYDTDIGTKPNRVGGPSTNLVLRWSLSFVGKDINGAKFTWLPPFLQNVATGPSGILNSMNLVLDPGLYEPNITLHIQLCDCRECELRAGQGRCVEFDIPFTAPPGPAAPPAHSSRSLVPGPGSSTVVSGRDAP